MDPFNEDLDFGSYIDDGPPLEPFGDCLQEQSVFNHQAANGIATGIIEDQIFYGDFLPVSESIPFPQVQPALQSDTSQISFMATVNEQQDMNWWPENAVDGRYRLSGTSLFDPYAELYSSELFSQPIQGASDQGPAMPTMVRKFP